ncbi:MAG TPA: hypothetical protein VLF18_09650 [Tahibacter sp.]|nr:hypothetical protein [Tahibacter sp.]
MARSTIVAGLRLGLACAAISAAGIAGSVAPSAGSDGVEPETIAKVAAPEVGAMFTTGALPADIGARHCEPLSARR